MEKRIGNYWYFNGALRAVTFGTGSRARVFQVGIAAAYDAYGLIGPEHNGIFILDESIRAVVLDRHCEEPSGYHGPSKKQWAELERICKMTWAQFSRFCISHPRYRA